MTTHHLPHIALLPEGGHILQPLIGALGGPPKKATPKPNYEAWRISYQSSEAAARAAWEEMSSLHQRLQTLEAHIAAIAHRAAQAAKDAP